MYSPTVMQPMGLGKWRGGHDSTSGGEEGSLGEDELGLTDEVDLDRWKMGYSIPVTAQFWSHRLSAK